MYYAKKQHSSIIIYSSFTQFPHLFDSLVFFTVGTKEHWRLSALNHGSFPILHVPVTYLPVWPFAKPSRDSSSDPPLFRLPRMLAFGETSCGGHNHYLPLHRTPHQPKPIRLALWNVFYGRFSFFVLDDCTIHRCTVHLGLPRFFCAMRNFTPIRHAALGSSNSVEWLLVAVALIL